MRPFEPLAATVKPPLLSTLNLLVPLSWKSRKLPLANVPEPLAKLSSKPVPVKAEVLCVKLISAPLVRAVAVAPSTKPSPV